MPIGHGPQVHHLLAALPEAGWARWLPQLERVKMPFGDVLYESGSQLYIDAQGMQPHSAPRPMSDADIAHTIEEYAQSARLAIEAGFDGIELHAANGYLIEQFLNANVNKRHDAWGGSPAGRNRFALGVARATAGAIGAERVGIRLSPYGVFNGTGAFAEVDSQYRALAIELSALGLLYYMCSIIRRWGRHPCRPPSRAICAGPLTAHSSSPVVSTAPALKEPWLKSRPT